MTEDFVPLDGNAAAGTLRRIFAFDATAASVVCRTCSSSGPLAELSFFGRPGALVLRCRSCEAVNVRALETDTHLNLDLSGISLLKVGSPAGEAQ